jgi:tol-pal system protein YbgF
MASLGHKTEERERVSNNQFAFKNKKGAWGLKILCLSFITFVLLPISAMAQPTPLYARPNLSDETMARMEIRLQEMERQIRDLTGRVEEQSFEINRLKTQKRVLEEQVAAQPVIKESATNPLRLDLTPPQPTGMKTIVPGGGDVQVTSQYEKALALLQNNQFDQARKEFDMFLKEKPDHSLAPNAKYWMGESYYAQGQFKTAARTFAEGFQAFPQSAKSPDILLKLGMSLAQMGKKGDACVALSQLPVKFPAGPEGILQRGAMEREKLNCES